jgi:hypothetical protein
MIRPAALGLLMAAGAASAGPAATLDLYRQPGFGGVSLRLDADVPRMHFAARSLRAAGTWQLCPRPMFGGACIEVEGEEDSLRLPRAFSGAIRSARVLAPPPAAADKAKPGMPPADPAKAKPPPPARDPGRT